MAAPPCIHRPRVVIIGCGFGGLSAARALHDAPVDVTLVDRSNHHLFQPLLYQVATAGLSAPAIAAPIRHLFRTQSNLTAPVWCDGPWLHPKTENANCFVPHSARFPYSHTHRPPQTAKDEPMTTVQIVLPDGLAQEAQAAGLLTPERMEIILREQLRLRAGDALRAIWQRRPAEELTPEIEQEIVDEVRAVREERRRRSVS